MGGARREARRSPKMKQGNIAAKQVKQCNIFDHFRVEKKGVRRKTAASPAQVSPVAAREQMPLKLRQRKETAGREKGVAFVSTRKSGKYANLPDINCLSDDEVKRIWCAPSGDDDEWEHSCSTSRSGSLRVALRDETVSVSARARDGTNVFDKAKKIFCAGMSAKDPAAE
mmetsp:Transcript_19934/g.50924  ORF Transcript_19934/g.50924 Transcript_19934/m.50924 type:complete len:170 (-) Transcript_19934:1252-1761(-)